MPEKHPLGHPHWQGMQAPSPHRVTLNTEPCSISFSTCPSTSCPPGSSASPHLSVPSGHQRSPDSSLQRRLGPAPSPDTPDPQTVPHSI